MKISFVLPSNSQSGGMRVIGIFAAGLRARGHEVFLLSQPYRAPTLREQARALLRWGRLKKHRRPGPFLDALSDVHRVLERQRPVTNADLPDADVVVATWWRTAHMVAGLDAAKGAKVYFMQDYGARGQEMEKLVPTWELPLTFITLTQALRGQILDVNPDADVTIVQNAADLERFTSPPRECPARPTFGVVYRPQASKGIDMALAALATAKAAPSLRLLAFGSAPDFPEAGNQPFEVSYHPRPDDAGLSALYGQCSAWLFPSRMEGYGLPISEAMACRTPVIGTRTGAAPDLIRPGKNGFLVDVDDVPAMADAIDAIAEMSPKQWRAMSEAAHKSVTDYDWDDATDAFEAVLRHAAERSGRHAATARTPLAAQGG